MSIGQLRGLQQKAAVSNRRAGSQPAPSLPPTLPAFPHTLTEVGVQGGRETGQQRCLFAFAGSALLLSVIGLYGVSELFHALPCL